MKDKQPPQRIELSATTLEWELGDVVRITFKKTGAFTLIDSRRLDRWALDQVRKELVLPIKE